MKKSITDTDCLNAVIARIAGNPDLLPELVEVAGPGVVAELSDPANWILTEKNGFYTCTRQYSAVAPSVPPDRITATVVVQDGAISKTAITDAVAQAAREADQAQALQQAQAQAQQGAGQPQAPVNATNFGQLLAQMAAGAAAPQQQGAGHGQPPGGFQSTGNPGLDQMIAQFIAATQGQQVPQQGQQAPQQAPAQSAGPPMMPIPTKDTVSAAGMSVIAQAVGATTHAFGGWGYAIIPSTSSRDRLVYIASTQDSAVGQLTTRHPDDIEKILRTQGLYHHAPCVFAIDHRHSDETVAAILEALNLIKDDRITKIVNP